MGYQHIQVPQSGEKITVNAEVALNITNHQIINVSEGDGTGVDIANIMDKVSEADGAKVSEGRKQISWREEYGGEKETERW